MKKSLVAILVGLLAGCSGLTSDIATQESLTAIKQTECCTPLADIKYVTLPLSNQITLNINQYSQVTKLTTGSSFVAGVEIPYSSSPIQVTISSAVDQRSVFIPSILVLDDKFEPIDAFNSDQLEYQSREFLNQAGYVGSIELPTRYLNGSRAAYLLVFTTDLDQRGSTPLEKPNDMAIQLGDVEANIAHNVGYEIQHVPVGAVSIKFNLDRINTATDQVQREEKIATFVEATAQLNTQNELASIYQNSIKLAVQEGDFAKALGYVEEAERKGVQGARETFVTAMKQYQE